MYAENCDTTPSFSQWYGIPEAFYTTHVNARPTAMVKPLPKTHSNFSIEYLLTAPSQPCKKPEKPELGQLEVQVYQNHDYPSCLDTPRSSTGGEKMCLDPIVDTTSSDILRIPTPADEEEADVVTNVYKFDEVSDDDRLADTPDSQATIAAYSCEDYPYEKPPSAMDLDLAEMRDVCGDQVDFLQGWNFQKRISRRPDRFNATLANQKSPAKVKHESKRIPKKRPPRFVADKENDTVPKARRGRVAKPRQPLQEQAKKALEEYPQIDEWKGLWTLQGSSTLKKIGVSSTSSEKYRECYESVQHTNGFIVRIGDCVSIEVANDEESGVGTVQHLYWDEQAAAPMAAIDWFYSYSQMELKEDARKDLHSIRDYQPHHRELYASRHRDSIPMWSVQRGVKVLTFDEYNRYMCDKKKLEFPEARRPPLYNEYLNTANPRHMRLANPSDPEEIVFFVRHTYELKGHRIYDAKRQAVEGKNWKPLQKRRVHEWPFSDTE
ncbi:unnamed protein product, partial [Mesorhabditis spiculigera]